MPFISDIPTSRREPGRLLLLGHSGAGKTGALLSLAKAGWILHILDCESKATDLFRTLTDNDNSILSRIDVEEVHENLGAKKSAMSGLSVGVQGKPKAFEESLKILDDWKDQNFDLDHIVVLDSLKAWSEFAGYLVASVNGRTTPVFQDYPAIYNLLKPMLGAITAFDPTTSDPTSQFNCHIIVLSHINLYEVKQKTGEKIRVGKTTVDETITIDTLAQPLAIGQALSPTVPTYFNSMLHVEQRSHGNATRLIHTRPHGIVPVKTPVQNLPKTLPIESGLADFFKAWGFTPSGSAK